MKAIEIIRFRMVSNKGVIYVSYKIEEREVKYSAPERGIRAGDEPVGPGQEV
jgi:hypothetical protein